MLERLQKWRAEKGKSSVTHKTAGAVVGVKKQVKKPLAAANNTKLTTTTQGKQK